MAADAKKRGLGRGLDALFRDVDEEEESFAAPRTKRADEMVRASQDMEKAGISPIEYKSHGEKTPPGQNAAPAPEGSPRRDGVQMLRTEKLLPGRFQPRRKFDESELEELAQSLEKHGVLQPLLVRPLPGDADGMHEIIGGERRWRAAQKARLHQLPVIIRDLTDRQALEIGLIENLQRADLTPLEEAEGYGRLLNEFAYTQDTVADQVGKSRSHVSHVLRILKLPDTVRKMLQDGQLSLGHVKALTRADNPVELANAIAKKGLSVRQAERLAQEGAKGKSSSGVGAKKPGEKPAGGIVRKDVDVMALEKNMSDLLGLNVQIDGAGGAGRLVIEYRTLDQLDDLLARLSTTPAAG